MFKCEFGAGHSSKSGRFEKLQEDAFIYTFIMKALDMVPAQGSGLNLLDCSSPANPSIKNLRGTTGLERHRLLSPSIVYGLRFLSPSFFYAPASASALSIVYASSSSASSLALLLGYQLYHTQKCWILSKQ